MQFSLCENLGIFPTQNFIGFFVIIFFNKNNLYYFFNKNKESPLHFSFKSLEKRSNSILVRHLVYFSENSVFGDYCQDENMLVTHLSFSKKIDMQYEFHSFNSRQVFTE